ncbi:MAG: sodium:solute symporter [Candidatus Marinimicrobia bacterium]|jgi:Na+/proline symporter|nr:sodium:solute symporter [Candidatus Neomarinimicrobiota bacterium]MCK9559418.1 sodium:solute symporter [Candidatus Neomarinimicrobiota bacterium]MDD5061794.1 sodium:solute symporter [Candidatus Neomarinimicrobiota bacterium]MDD5230254.1 sodium:solute symporter [Candidatus Neomarinimicrobiota bacterium]MDD5539154.1 sodium:solute symporter [Candidatus Neomarinimicrobiota bacterium]
MHALDYVIIVVYLIGMVSVGLWFQRKAAQGIDSYFLGNRSLPWWVLGSSGMASNLDISGTMIIVALVYALGVRGLFIEFRGGVTLIMAFLMIFMGKWNRRSKVMTLAEWMEFRFGKDGEGRLARLITALTSIIVTIAMITYFAVGGGKFLDKFLGIPNFLGLSSQFWAAAALIAIAMIYTVASGLYGVVWTDVFQGSLIFIMIVYVVFRALNFNLPAEFSVMMPLKDIAGGGFRAFPTTYQEWTDVLPKLRLAIDSTSVYSMYNLFGIAVLFYIIKVVIEGSGGTGSYMIQRYYAAKSDRDAGLLSLFWTFLLSFRWFFVGAMAVWGIYLGARITDPEMVLPIVVETLPIGIKGFLIAGMMAAAMSTFDSTVNAGAAYWVKDIYLEYINKKATDRQQMRQSYGASIVIVVLGLALTLIIKNINEIWGWITMSIGAGLIVPQLIRWYWWRLNGYGYAIGMAAGMLASIIWKIIAPEATAEFLAFLFAAGISAIATIIGTLLTKPTDSKVLDNFYRVTRPFGFWGAIRSKLPERVRQQINRENRRDIISIFFAVPWQVCLFMMWMVLVMKRFDTFLSLLLIVLALSLILYFTWFRHLSTEVDVDSESSSA